MSAPPRLPRETKEYLPTWMTGDGIPLTEFEVQVTRNYERPEADGWNSIVVVDGKTAFLLDGPALGPGHFKVWTRKPDAPEQTVVEAGEFVLT